MLIDLNKFWSHWPKTLFVILCHRYSTSTMAEEISAETEMPPFLYESILKLDGVIPEVLLEPPKYVLNVTYPPNLEVEFGTELLPSELKVKPKIRKWYTKNDFHYVLVMTGMDEPLCKNATEFQYLYWFVGNIPGTNISAGHEYAPYLPPKPKRDTELHRYVFVLYQQPKKLDFNQPTLLLDYNDCRRTCFSTLKFWSDYKLIPWASNSFTAGYNETTRPVSQNLSLSTQSSVAHNPEAWEFIFRSRSTPKS